MPKKAPPAARPSEQARALIAKERGVLEAAKEKFDGLEAELKSAFPKMVKEGLSEEEISMIDLADDPAELAAFFMNKYEQLVIEPIEVERAALEEAEDQLEQKEFTTDLLEAEEAFIEAHPEVDIEAFTEFLHRELSPAQLDTLNEESGGDKAKHFELAFGLFSGNKGTSKEDEAAATPDLDTDISGIAGETGDIDGEGATDADEDFMTQMGMDR